LIARTIISPFLASPKSNLKIVNQVFDQPEQQLILQSKDLIGHYSQQAGCLLQDRDDMVMFVFARQGSRGNLHK
jgi:hypothetical protein